MMKLFRGGAGPPVVVVPGMNGRWEWMRPGLEALAVEARVLSYSLCGEPGSGWPYPSGSPFDAHVAQLDALLDRAGLEPVVLCGVSLGGWIALRYAARHPSRVAGLVLNSTPGPGFALNPLQRRFTRAPFVLAPLFVATSPGRLGAEIVAALPDAKTRLRFLRRHLLRIALAPTSPRRMARRVVGALQHDFRLDCGDVTVPTLLLTGDSGLDRVVPVTSTSEYLQLIPGARHATIARTGHLGLVTRPGDWAAAIAAFARDSLRAGSG
jgi:pimeloyl-ACP methyl ester carboxylesterase